MGTKCPAQIADSIKNPFIAHCAHKFTFAVADMDYCIRTPPPHSKAMLKKYNTILRHPYADSWLMIRPWTNNCLPVKGSVSDWTKPYDYCPVVSLGTFQTSKNDFAKGWPKGRDLGEDYIFYQVLGFSNKRPLESTSAKQRKFSPDAEAEETWWTNNKEDLSLLDNAPTSFGYNPESMIPGWSTKLNNAKRVFLPVNERQVHRKGNILNIKLAKNCPRMIPTDEKYLEFQDHMLSRNNLDKYFDEI